MEKLTGEFAFTSKEKQALIHLLPPEISGSSFPTPIRSFLATGLAGQAKVTEIIEKTSDLKVEEKLK